MIKRKKNPTESIHNQLAKIIQLSDPPYKEGFKLILHIIEINNNFFHHGKLAKFHHPLEKNTDQLKLMLEFWKKDKAQIAVVKARFYPEWYGKTGIQIVKEVYREDVSDIKITNEDILEQSQLFWNYVDEICNYYQNSKILERIRKEILEEYEIL